MAKALLDANGKPIKCSEQIYDGVYYNHACSHNAKVFRPASSGDGSYYCLMHDPVRKAEKIAERHRQWKESWDRKDAERATRKAELVQEIINCTSENLADALFDKICRRGY
jgi:hypothetical protein